MVLLSSPFSVPVLQVSKILAIHATWLPSFRLCSRFSLFKVTFLLIWVVVIMLIIDFLWTFEERYNSSYAKTHEQSCEKLPADCLECQMCKITDGLVSGRYSVPRTHASASSITTQKPEFQEGIRPVMFKNVIGKGHAEFSTMRQQDSEEFLTHLVQTLRRELHKFKSRGIGMSRTPHDPSSH